VTAPIDCRLIGRWRIVEADLWDRDYLDLVVPATMTIGADGHGEIAYGAMQASLELEYSRSIVFFTWAGFDEMDEVTGAPPNSTTMAPSRSRSPTTSATRPSSSRTNHFFNSLLGARVECSPLVHAVLPRTRPLRMAPPPTPVGRLWLGPHRSTMKSYNAGARGPSLV
jgi:hypothetical protein